MHKGNNRYAQACPLYTHPDWILRFILSVLNKKRVDFVDRVISLFDLKLYLLRFPSVYFKRSLEMAYFDLNAIKNAMITSSWNSLIKAWYDVESVSQEISTLILSPERNLEAVTEGLKRWKEHAGLLSWNVTVHSLLLHDDARSSRLLSTAVCCWKAVQLLVVQFEKLLFNQKEKGVEDTVWLQIQGLVKKFGVLLLKRFTREQCGLDDFSLERKGAGDNDPGEKCFTRPGIPYPSKKTRRTTKVAIAPKCEPLSKTLSANSLPNDETLRN